MDESVFEFDEGGKLDAVLFVVWESGSAEGGGRSALGGDDDGGGLYRLPVVVIGLVKFGRYGVEDPGRILIRDL
jgi:hypothetical protein